MTPYPMAIDTVGMEEKILLSSKTTDCILFIVSSWKTPRGTFFTRVLFALSCSVAAFWTKQEISFFILPDGRLTKLSIAIPVICLCSCDIAGFIVDRSDIKTITNILLIVPSRSLYLWGLLIILD